MYKLLVVVARAEYSFRKAVFRGLVGSLGAKWVQGRIERIEKRRDNHLVGRDIGCLFSFCVPYSVSRAVRMRRGRPVIRLVKD